MSGDDIQLERDLGEVARHHGAAARACAARILGCERDVEDVVQESLIVLWRQWDAARTPEHCRNLFLLIVRRKAFDLLKSGWSRCHPCGTPEPRDTYPGADDRVLRNSWVDSVFAVVPPDTRAVVREHLCEGVSLADLARANGLSHDALRARKARTMPVLREHVRQVGPWTA